MQNKLPKSWQSPNLAYERERIAKIQQTVLLTAYSWLNGHFRWEMIISRWRKVPLPTFPFWIESFKSARFQGMMAVFAGQPVEVGDTLLVASYHQACFQRPDHFALEPSLICSRACHWLWVVYGAMDAQSPTPIQRGGKNGDGKARTKLYRWRI